MDNRSIGVFDSGIGGLTVVKELMEILPNEKIVYFGDTARVPYGNRSEDTIKRFSKECIEFLDRKDIKALIIACNTVSAVALDMLKEIFDMYILGVIVPGSKMANNITINKKIGVIGTNATILSGAYEKNIKNESIENIVYSKACPLFVPIVEDGLSDTTIAMETTKFYLDELIKQNVDTIVMGCTHYPILENTIKTVVGKNINLVNPAKETAIEMKNYLEKNSLLNEEVQNNKNNIFYITDDENKFRRNLLDFINIDNPNIKKINLKEKCIDEK